MVSAACKRTKVEQSEYFFTQREVRDATGWPDHQVKLHLRKLVEMEYVLLHRGGRGQSFVYELLYRGEGESGKPFLMGLIDAAKLAHDDNRDSPKSNRDSRKGERDIAGTARGHIGDSPGTSTQKARNASADAALFDVESNTDEKTLLGSEAEGPVDPSPNLKYPKPEKKVRRYLLRDRGGNGRAASFSPGALRRRPSREKE